MGIRCFLEVKTPRIEENLSILYHLSISKIKVAYFITLEVLLPPQWSLQDASFKSPRIPFRIMFLIFELSTLSFQYKCHPIEAKQ